MCWLPAARPRRSALLKVAPPGVCVQGGKPEFKDWSMAAMQALKQGRKASLLRAAPICKALLEASAAHLA